MTVGAVQHQLKGVQQIQATDHAFAAIRGDGSVVTWGFAGTGGDSSAVQDQLSNVKHVQASLYASMNACMYASMHVCTYVSTSVCMYFCWLVCMHACMHLGV